MSSILQIASLTVPAWTRCIAVDGPWAALRWEDVQAYLQRWPKAAERAGFSRDLVYDRIEDGKLPTVRVGVYHAVRWKDVRAAIHSP